MNLADKISEIPRVGPSYQSRLKKIGILKVEDFFWNFPRNYQDLSAVKKINEIVIGELNTVKGVIKSLKNTPARFARIDITKCILQDETGAIEVVWFNQKYLHNTLKDGMEVMISGKVKFDRGKASFQSPSFEPVKENQVHTGRIVPVYKEFDGVSSKWIRSIVEPLLYLTERVEDHFDAEFCKAQGILRLSEALKNIHFPENMEMLKKAKERLGFDELFFLQLKAMINRIEWRKSNVDENDKKIIPLDEKLIKDFLKTLPFELTNDQKIVLYEIMKDMEKGYPMLRLLEGDVGSGKTVVAAAAIYMACKNGFQGAIMAPTEVLCRQHYTTVSKMLMNFGFNIQILVGSTTEKEKKEIKTGLKNGIIDVVIGTHALLQSDVGFNNIGLIVIDEQHRFGVEQRMILKQKGNPHLLNMTATPIPRTLALTIYGDQDLSIIEEMPKGRKEIITRVISPKYRRQAELFVEDQVKKGRQVFVICPLIEESDVLEVKSVTQEFERLSNDIFPHLRVEMLHGRMKAYEKNRIMEDFKNKKFDILVSTSVVEVGVDVPNATMMVIEGAERFGLAQLHQFRGRVGRGEHQSYCLLYTDNLNEMNRKRMRAMVDFSSGFKLAEIDLKIRGPGEVFGIRQSGVPDLKMASLSDKKLILKSREAVDKVLEYDHNLKEYPLINRRLEKFLEKLYA